MMMKRNESQTLGDDTSQYLVFHHRALQGCGWSREGVEGCWGGGGGAEEGDLVRLS